MTSPQEVDLRPEIVNVGVMRGDEWSIGVTFKPDGVVTDISAWTIQAQLRTTPDSTPPIALDITPNDLTLGTFFIGQSAASVGGVYDLQLTPPAGLPRTYVRGRLSVSKDVTHA